MKIGSTVRRLRTALGLTMEELADRAGVTPQTIWNIESDRSFPRMPTIRKLAEALGVEPEDLLRPQVDEDPPGLRAMLEQGLAEPPPTQQEILEMRELAFRGEPDAVAYLYALQAIRRANARATRDDGDSGPPVSDP